MKLIAARVKDYKSVIDSDSFKVDDLTCLVGKNESGKTAVLEALEKVKAARSERSSFQEIDFPRLKFDEYNGNVVAVETRWELDDEEAEELARLAGGKDGLSSREVTVRKDFANRVKWSLPFDESAAIANHVDATALSDKEAALLKAETTTGGLLDALNESTEPSPQRQALQTALADLWGGEDLLQAAVDFLSPRLPTFVYYSEYDRLPGRISVTQVRQHVANQNLEALPGANVFLALLSMAGTSLDELEGLTTSEGLFSRLEGVQAKMSKRVFKYWTQNKSLKVRFDYRDASPGDDAPYNTGKVFQTRIENTRHEATISLDERSTGFIWFFSFLVWFSQVTDVHGENLIVLLDEPGLSLHAKAQQDLLRFIKEELLPKYQVLYTTHSPFMIDRNDLLSCRTVEDLSAPDGEVLGTKVSADVLRANGDTLFALRAALGYDISQSLFVGEHVLLVEGPSDLLYLQWASQELQKRGRTPLDPRWTLTPCGGITKIPSFLALFAGNNLHVAILTDLGDGDRNNVRRIRESELLRSGHVFVALDYSDNSESADTEDILGRVVYADLVNRTYGLTGQARMPSKKPANSDERVAVEARQRSETEEWPVRYNHYEPAQYLAIHPECVAGKALDQALGRFEHLFMDLNGLL